MLQKQARQESNLQPPVLEPTPSNAGVAPFVDFQRLSFGSTTPASLDTAGVGTNLTLRKTNSDAPQGRGKDPLSALDESASAFAPWPLPSARGTRSRTGARHRARL